MLKGFSCSWLRTIPFLAGCFALTGSFSARAGSTPQDAHAPEWEANTRISLEKMAATLTETLKPWPVPVRTFRVDDYGAKPDGVTLNTAALQRAIDACSASGGGVVLFARGDYVTGTIELKSGVMLEVDGGARILGSTHLPDYPDKVAVHQTIMDYKMHINTSLIYAENCERIGIRGDGTIDGRGESKNFPRTDMKPHAPITGRPFLMRIIECRKVVMDGIHLRDSASWMEDYLNCDDLILQGIKVDNQANYNEDGFDIDGCRNVIVRNCLINSHDDGMCFKGAGLRTMENVLVENCTAYSDCNALKFGTDSEADFRNVLIRNIKTGGVPEELPAFKRRLALSGIAWESVDGGTVENILVTNAQIDRADAPIFLRLGDRGHAKPDTSKPAPGKLRQLIFEQITGTNNGKLGSIVAGIPEARIQDVVIRNMQLSTLGGGKPDHAEIPEHVSDYPDPPMFGRDLPAYGFWLRHADGVTFQDVKIVPMKLDPRPQFDAGADTANIVLDGSPLNGPAAQPKR
jgi:polygalacturonase